jgi:rhamnulokinase
MGKDHFLAFDLGASGGRAILGTLENSRLTLFEVHRFKNRMTRVHGAFYWNIFNLFEEMKKGLKRCINECHVKPRSIGIDTWGVDYALVNCQGRLNGLPRAYRDHRTDHAMEQFFRVLPERETYILTGIQFMQFNTLFQLYASVLAGDPELMTADRILFTPDVFNFLFTGVMKNEYTISSTSQLLKPGSPDWETRLIHAAGIDESLFGEIVQPGTLLGSVLPEVQEETGCGDIPCVAVASHDTASAVVSVPAEGENWAYLSSGTWSLLGIESDRPLVSEDSMRMNFTNEGGVGGKTRFLKNIMGMWLIQECKRIWDGQREMDWAEIVDLSKKAEPFKCLINPDHPMFLNPDNMPLAVAEFCKETGQPVPETKGEIARSVYDSLALKYKYTLEQMESITGRRIEKLHIIGGGANNEMLNQFTADALGIPVLAGPAEATAIGNILMQAKALQVVDSLKDIRQVVRNSFDVKTYVPSAVQEWNQAWEKFKKLI